MRVPQQHLLPFPHIIIDEYLTLAQVRAINAAWPTEWDEERASHAYKRNTQDLSSPALDVVRSIDAGWVGGMLNLREELFADPTLYGAGLHAIPTGGYLKMHVDFNVHPKGWHRRANVLIYLNENWLPEWGGALRLGLNGTAVEIQPIAGRLVMFETNDASWHGHPGPLTCPEYRERRSLALYFYSRTPAGRKHNTIYRGELSS